MPPSSSPFAYFADQRLVASERLVAARREQVMEAAASDVARLVEAIDDFAVAVRENERLRREH